MRAALVTGAFLLAALALAPLAGASCHFCSAPEPGAPVYEALYRLLP